MSAYETHAAELEKRSALVAEILNSPVDRADQLLEIHRLLTEMSGDLAKMDLAVDLDTIGDMAFAPAEERPAMCSGCGKRSDPRPMGQTPPDWTREKDSGQGRYWCPDCSEPTPEERQQASWLTKVEHPDA